MKVFQAQPPDYAIPSALDWEKTDSAFSFVHPQWTADEETRLREKFGEAADISSMPLRDIFLSLARSYQKRAS